MQEWQKPTALHLWMASGCVFSEGGILWFNESISVCILWVGVLYKLVIEIKVLFSMGCTRCDYSIPTVTDCPPSAVPFSSPCNAHPSHCFHYLGNTRYLFGSIDVNESLNDRFMSLLACSMSSTDFLCFTLQPCSSLVSGPSSCQVTQCHQC